MSTKKKQKRNRMISLRFKSMAVILFTAVILSSVAAIVSYFSYSSTMDEHYKSLAENLAKTTASQLDTDELHRYYNEVKKIGVFDLEKYQNDEAYRKEYDKKADALKDEKYYQILNMLFDIKDNNSDILYLYVQILDKGNDTITYIFDADHADDKYQLGTVHELSGPAKETEHPENGLPAFITNEEEYGWLASSVVPVLDSNGKPSALVGIDISMEDIMQDRADYLKNVLLSMCISVILLGIILMLTVNSTLVKPINKLSEATETFVKHRSENTDAVSNLSKLNIKTGDEVETLCDSIKQMEKDINEYINHLTAVTAEKERIGAELELATRIQADMLPNIYPAFPERDDLDIYASMTPAKEVGGDFYDFFLVDDSHLAMVMADVSGKGVPAALFMMMSKILIQNAVMSGKSPADALMAVNNQICANNREEMFVTVWLGVIDLNSGLITAANAGHEKPIIKLPDKDFELFNDKHGFVIGGMEGLKYRNYEIQLEKGSKLFLYTDGVVEATNSADELYGIERTLDALNGCNVERPTDILKAVKESVDEFVGTAPQFDDLTMLCFEYSGDKNTLTVDATLENVAKAVDFVGEIAQLLPFTLREKNQIEIAIDEIVSNVARYSYGEDTGKVSVKVDTDSEGITITISDEGVPYNPLEKEDPDITLSADERGIGGYGIFIVKNTMDNIEYENRNGKNILTLRKNFNS